ncbi:MAG: hypothetical protein LLF98_08765 [Clostridium sp.]|uniref:hypothetical protein n=1 Tax=Clostridium sp. TaxID=1506 RepID=UPI0025C02A99|nr:hypothetical protein [Clostridium sp.]MCE5221334.1 hypothetical protein [Clostridium sp.]
MKKFTMSLLILICLSFNILQVTSANSSNVFKEGIYNISDFNLSSDNLYTVQNVSDKNDLYILIFDENKIGLQYIRLTTKSQKYNMVPLKPTYKLVVLGEGEAFIDKVHS